MNWNLFWGLYILAFAAAIWICFYIFGIRKKNKSARCSMRVTGRVVRYSAVHYNGIHVPLVEYVVDGKTYKIAGPRFSSVVVKTVRTPFEDPNAKIETNLTTREDLPRGLRVKVRRNNFMSVETSPLMKLYPIDSIVDVYYDPRRPKVAFVQRDEGVPGWIPVMLAVFGIVLTVGGIGVLFGPEIIMH